MTRKDFVKVCALLGVSLPFQSVMHACSSDDNASGGGSFNGKVLVIGAGPAGLSAAYLLAQQGIDFQIIEANTVIGGRIRHNTSFVDYPISLGGEWMHTSNNILPDIVNDSSVQISTQLVGYGPQDLVGHYENGTYIEGTMAQAGESSVDKKFVGSSWFGFFEEYIVPSVSDKIILNKPIANINYSGDKVIASTNSGESFEGDRVIVTVPLKILKDNDLTFTPALPSDKIEALQNASIWGGFKMFIQFSQKFYPTTLSFADSETGAGQRIYYDAGHGQNSNHHVLGLFSVGQQAEQYQNLSGNALKDYVLAELDAVYNGQASQYYMQHISQNWNNEPFAKAAYLPDNADWRIPRDMGRPINNRVYFAGDGYLQSGEDWSSVHVAVRTARDVVNAIMA